MNVSLVLCLPASHTADLTSEGTILLGTVVGRREKKLSLGLRTDG